jgi:hypothetical protein
MGDAMPLSTARAETLLAGVDVDLDGLLFCGGGGLLVVPPGGLSPRVCAETVTTTPRRQAHETHNAKVPERGVIRGVSFTRYGRAGDVDGSDRESGAVDSARGSGCVDSALGSGVSDSARGSGFADSARGSGFVDSARGSGLADSARGSGFVDAARAAGFVDSARVAGLAD